MLLITRIHTQPSTVTQQHSQYLILTTYLELVHESKPHSNGLLGPRSNGIQQVSFCGAESQQVARSQNTFDGVYEQTVVAYDLVVAGRGEKSGRMVSKTDRSDNNTNTRTFPRPSSTVTGSLALVAKRWE